MKNLSYSTQDSDKICASVEEKLRDELKSPTPIAFSVQDEAEVKTSLGTIFGDAGRALVGGAANDLFTMAFEVQTPRPGTLYAHIIRQGVGARVGLLQYATALSKSVPGPASLEAPKMFGSSKFAGDAVVAKALNANGDLIKRVNKLARTETEVGGLTTKIERLMQVAPHADGSVVLLHTLPRLTSMGFNAALDADEFFALAQMIEASL